MYMGLIGLRSGSKEFLDNKRRKKNRIEHDSIGDKEVPIDAYYGVQSLRAAENFPITGLDLHPEVVNSIVYIKKAAAITNSETGRLSKGWGRNLPEHERQ